VFLIGFPLLILAFAIYNILAFFLGFVRPEDWTATIATVRMMSGGEWKISVTDILLALSLVLLFFEIIKSTRHSTRSIMDHMLSTVVFIAALIEFLLVDRAATSTFALLLLISLVDVVGGYSVSIRTAQRDYNIERADTI
jgi:uncharacterized membrane protein YqhA